jgi:hypothetical protein
MTSFRIRPRFKHLSSLSISELEKLVSQKLAGQNEVKGDQLTGHVYLKIPVADRHFWSPQLHITLEKAESGTLIRGLYGPNPTVWAIFFFGYVLLGLSFFFLGMWGLSQLSLGIESEILWLLPVIGGLAGVLYLIAQTGQKLGVEQTFKLHQFYESAVGQKIHLA